MRLATVNFVQMYTWSQIPYTRIFYGPIWISLQKKRLNLIWI